MHCFPLNCLLTGEGSRGSLVSSSISKQSRMCRQDLLVLQPSPGCFLYPQQDSFMLTSLCFPLYNVQGSLHYSAVPASVLLPQDQRANCSSSPLPASRDWDPCVSPRPPGISSLGVPQCFCCLQQNIWTPQVTRGQSLTRIYVVLLLLYRIRAKVGEKNIKCCLKSAHPNPSSSFQGKDLQPYRSGSLKGKDAVRTTAGQKVESRAVKDGRMFSVPKCLTLRSMSFIALICSGPLAQSFSTESE